MTNEEKAREISSQYDYIGIAEDAALDMAEWKDKQFKEYLKKKLDEYMSQRDNKKMWSEQWSVFHALACTMHQIINELFPKQEQDNSDNDE